jgi:hypothetical protein
LPLANLKVVTRYIVRPAHDPNISPPVPRGYIGHVKTIFVLDISSFNGGLRPCRPLIPLLDSLLFLKITGVIKRGGAVSTNSEEQIKATVGNGELI